MPALLWQPHGQEGVGGWGVGVSIQARLGPEGDVSRDFAAQGGAGWRAGVPWGTAACLRLACPPSAPRGLCRRGERSAQQPAGPSGQASPEAQEWGPLALGPHHLHGSCLGLASPGRSASGSASAWPASVRPAGPGCPRMPNAHGFQTTLAFPRKMPPFLCWAELWPPKMSMPRTYEPVMWHGRETEAANEMRWG